MKKIGKNAAKFLRFMGVISFFALPFNAIAGTEPGSAESLGFLTNVQTVISTVNQVVAEASASRINDEQAKLMLDMQVSALSSVRLSAVGIKQIRGGQSFCLDQVTRTSSTSAQSIQMYTAGKITSEQMLLLLDMQKEAANTVAITCRVLSEGNGVDR